MANPFDQLISMITKIVLDVTRFNVPRIGKVVQINDPDLKSRVLVQIPTLGWDTNEKAAWCYPKDKKALITPEVNAWVIVEFIDGNMNLPVYSGMANQMKNMLPKNYTDENSQILFENRLKDFTIKFDESTQVLKIGEATESFVLGDTAKTELQKNIDALTQLQTDFTSWVPVPNDGGAALKTILTGGFLTSILASLNSILSDTIKGE